MTPAAYLEVAPVHALPPPADPRWRDWLEPAELAYCTGLRRAGEHLAARVAGRRAVLAALGLPSGASLWPDVRIRRAPSGRPTVAVSERLDRWRESRGLAVPDVSLSHAAGHAAALAWVPGAGATEFPEGRKPT
jgi:phosphopantetheinyl transferase (holo-ACP synthase)